VHTNNNLGGMFSTLSNLSGRFPETECFVLYTNFRADFPRAVSRALIRESLLCRRVSANEADALRDFAGQSCPS